MRKLTVKQLDYDLTPVAGLALVGHYLNALAPHLARIDAALPVRGGVSNSDVLRSYLGLLVQGKSDFDAIDNYRGDAFYKQALGIGLLPSCPTLRQRLDARAAELFESVPPMIESLLAGQKADYGVLPCGWLPLDVDTFAMDNSGTSKEGVGRTYVGVDGYCPLAAYFGAHGFCLELALRPGEQHSTRETELNVQRVVPMAQRLSRAAHGANKNAPILVRLDAGFDSQALMGEIHQCNQAGLPAVDWLVKWNPRSTDVAALAERLEGEATTVWQTPRAGKRVTTWEVALEVEGVHLKDGKPRPVRRVLRLIERTIDAKGQVLLVPDYKLEGWTTSLAAHAERAGHHRVVRRPRHARAVPLRVQDRPRSDTAALGQVRLQLPDLPARGAGNEHPASDGPARAAWGRCARAPQRQTSAHQDGDSRADLPRGQADRARQATGARAGGQ